VGEIIESAKSILALNLPPVGSSTAEEFYSLGDQTMFGGVPTLKLLLLRGQKSMIWGEFSNSPSVEGVRGCSRPINRKLNFLE
jgi:hypothetical protein